MTITIITRWNSTGCRRLRLLWPWPLTFWPENPISKFLAQIHMWSNFGEISSNHFKNIVFITFIGSLLAVTLTFDPWPQNLICTSINANTSAAKFGWNFFHWFLRYDVPLNIRQWWCLQGFWAAQTHRLTHGWSHLKTVCLQHKSSSSSHCL